MRLLDMYYVNLKVHHPEGATPTIIEGDLKPTISLHQ